jgi:hypothetical protein
MTPLHSLICLGTLRRVNTHYTANHDLKFFKESKG